jgi:hypothetical protein
MAPYRHHVPGFFAPRQDAERALAGLVRSGLPLERLQMFDAGVAPPAAATPTRSDAALKDMLVDCAVGAAVGTGIGALAELVLVAATSACSSPGP